MNKSPRLRYWKHLESTQNLSTDELIQKQWNRLQSLIRFVYRYNKFYRVRFEQAGLHPSDIRTHRDITLLPVLTKEEIKKNLYDMISDGYQMENLLKFKTGGSTGKALELFITEECSELRNACARRHDRWSGWEVGEPIGAVWGNPVLPSSIKSKLREWLLYPMIYLDTMNLNDYSVTKFAKDWIRVKPTLLFGHAHSIFVLAEYVRKLEIKTIKPRGILSTSMMLMPHERHTIEEVFGIKVIDRYGCEEVSLIASECERHEGMHLNIEHLYIEFIKEDGSPAVSGEIGRIIVTDLMNMAMPFIRYQVDDMGIPIDKKCSCGRGLPLMDKVIGRTADFLIRQDGSRVAGVSLIENTLTKIPGIEQMQIIQDSLDRIILNVVKDMEYKDATDQSLRGYFQDLFGSNCNIIINLVQEIRPEKSGKYRFSICNII
ncbi:MAG TPA: hypothetical protein PLX41_07040 [Bacteroidales bacterium]|nr:hypothetical protein [Bacteroidales bacterium]